MKISIISIEKDRDHADKLQDILQLVINEYEQATKKFGKFTSSHEGIAIVQEEFEELKEAVFWPHRMDSGEIDQEATQLTAMGLRFLMDVVYD